MLRSALRERDVSGFFADAYTSVDQIGRTDPSLNGIRGQLFIYCGSLFYEVRVDLDALIAQTTLKRITRVWLYRDHFRELLERKRTSVVSAMLNQWRMNFLRFEVGPTKDVARMILKHFDAIVVWIQTRQTTNKSLRAACRRANSYSFFALLAALCPRTPAQAIEEKYVVRMQEDASSVPLASQILGNLAPGLRRDVLDVAWSPDGRILATVDMSLALTLWTDEGKTRREVGKVAGGSDCLAFLDHGREILTPIGKVEVPSGPEAANGAFTIWKLDTPAILRHVDKPSEDIGNKTQFRHCKVSPDERFFAVIADSPPYHVVIYSTHNWKVQRTVHFPDRPRGVYVPDALAFSPDSRLLAIGASDKIFLASLDDQARPLDVIATYSNPSNVGLGMGTDALAFNLDGSLLASAANGPNPPDHSLQPVDPIQVWRVKDHSRVASWTGDFLARDLAWSADGRHFVAGTTNGIRAFAPLAPTEAPQVVYAGNSIFALASPDGRWLAVWGANKVTVFDISR